jgi:signal transduction histidine kinase
MTTADMHESHLELATIIHDLRNPLTALVLRAEMARGYPGRRSGMVSGEVERGLSELESLAHQMTRLLDDMLARFRPSGDDLAARGVTGTDLTVVLARAAKQVEQALEQPRILLQLPSRPIAGPWDAGKLGRVFVNILENALKYSPDGEAVAVAVHYDGAEVTVTVRDPGIGIPADDLPRLFDPYARGSNTGARFTGTGLGLASVRRLIESQGGAIVVTSVEGVGTTVTVTLPVDAATIWNGDRHLVSQQEIGHGD